MRAEMWSQCSRGLAVTFKITKVKNNKNNQGEK